MFESTYLGASGAIFSQVHASAVSSILHVRQLLRFWLAVAIQGLAAVAVLNKGFRQVTCRGENPVLQSFVSL